MNYLTAASCCRYADDWTANGTSLVIGYPNNTFTSKLSYILRRDLFSELQAYNHHSTSCLLADDSIPSPSGSYQPRWDSYFRHVTVLIYQ